MHDDADPTRIARHSIPSNVRYCDCIHIVDAVHASRHGVCAHAEKDALPQRHPSGVQSRHAAFRRSLKCTKKRGLAAPFLFARTGKGAVSGCDWTLCDALPKHFRGTARFRCATVQEVPNRWPGQARAHCVRASVRCVAWAHGRGRDVPAASRCVPVPIRASASCCAPGPPDAPARSRGSVPPGGSASIRVFRCHVVPARCGPVPVMRA